MSHPEPHSAFASLDLTPSAQAIYARLRQSMPHLRVLLGRDATFAECGGDSLDLVELSCVIDSDYGIRLSIDDFASVRTMSELLTMIDQRAIRRPPAISS